MSRGTVLTSDIHRIINDVYQNNPKLRTKPKAFHKKVYQLVHKQIEWADSNWPGESVIKKELIELRRKDEARPPALKELDKPWSIGTLAKYPIPSESLPLVISNYWYCLGEVNRKLAETREWDDRYLLTIREALWIGRLHKIIEYFIANYKIPVPTPEDQELLLKLEQSLHQTDEKKYPEHYQQMQAMIETLHFRLKPPEEGFKKLKVEDLILDWAFSFAQEEIYLEINPEESETSKLDGDISSGVFYNVGIRQEVLEYEDLEDKDIVRGNKGRRIINLTSVRSQMKKLGIKEEQLEGVLKILDEVMEAQNEGLNYRTR